MSEADLLEFDFNDALDEMSHMFSRKNRDYGHRNLAIGGVKGVVLRMGDKVGRLWNLVGLSGDAKEPLVSNESIADTFLDAANYAVVGYLMVTGRWPKATADEVFGRDAAMKILEELTRSEIKIENSKLSHIVSQYGAPISEQD